MLLGWSMGGAAVIEAAARLSRPGTARAAEPPKLAGVVTLASQSAGVFGLGNMHGGANSLRVSARLLGELAIPLVAMHGSKDECVPPSSTGKIADQVAAAPSCSRVVEHLFEWVVRRHPKPQINIPAWVFCMKGVLTWGSGERRSGPSPVTPGLLCSTGTTMESARLTRTCSRLWTRCCSFLAGCQDIKQCCRACFRM